MLFLTLERKQKKFFKFISNSHIFLFLSYSFEMETINFSYIPVVPSKTIPDSRLKWARCIPVFRAKQCKNPTRWGGTYLFGLYKGAPPPLGIEKIHVIVIAFVYLEYKQNSSSKSNKSCRWYSSGWLRRNYIPCLGQRGQKPCPDQRHIPVQAI